MPAHEHLVRGPGRCATARGLTVLRHDVLGEELDELLERDQPRCGSRSLGASSDRHRSTVRRRRSTTTSHGRVDAVEFVEAGHCHVEVILGEQGRMLVRRKPSRRPRTAMFTMLSGTYPDVESVIVPRSARPEPEDFTACTALDDQRIGRSQ